MSTTGARPTTTRPTTTQPTTTQPTTTIVVPCYDEAERFSPDAFLAFVAVAPWVRFILVDDGSRDETGAMLSGLRERDRSHFDVCVHPYNRGQAEAVRTGVRIALERGDTYVGYWDADLAAPLEEIRRFVQMLDADPACTVVFGSRAPLPTNQITRTWYRGLLGRVFARVARAVHGLGVRDTQCGAKLFRNCAEVEQIFAQPFRSRWIFDVEILARLIRIKGTRRAVERCVRELPLSSWQDVRGTKLRLSDFLRAPLEILQIQRDLHRV